MDLLDGIGEGDLTESNIHNAKVFVCRLYGCTVDSVDSVDKACSYLFGKSKCPKQMPPTSDAFICSGHK